MDGLTELLEWADDNAGDGLLLDIDNDQTFEFHGFPPSLDYLKIFPFVLGQKDCYGVSVLQTKCLYL